MLQYFHCKTISTSSKQFKKLLKLTLALSQEIIQI